MKIDDLKGIIRNVPDFPLKGVVFRDITTLINNPEAFRLVIDHLEARYRDRKIDHIVAVESRGFIFGGALADRLGCGLILARKPGKLPAQTIEESYELEYGRASLQIHIDSLKKGKRILIVDDLMATGGTLDAAAGLVDRLGGELVEIAVVIELSFLHGRRNLQGRKIYSIIEYQSE